MMGQDQNLFKEVKCSRWLDKSLLLTLLPSHSSWTFHAQTILDSVGQVTLHGHKKVEAAL
jgi:hypothetical protein